MACNYCILKELVLNQLIRLPWISRLARRKHRTGRNGNTDEIDSIFHCLSTETDAKGKRVLELGPGQTIGILERFKNAGAVRVVAADIDIYPEILNTGIDIVHYDGIALPFPDNSFDIIYSWSVMEHVRHPEKVMREMHRVLAPGGILMHSIDLVDHFYYSSGLEKCIFHCLSYPEWLWNAMTWHRSNYVNRLRAGQWRNNIQDSGFQIRTWNPEAIGPAIQWYEDGQMPYLAHVSKEDATTRSLFVSATK